MAQEYIVAFMENLARINGFSNHDELTKLTIFLLIQKFQCKKWNSGFMERARLDGFDNPINRIRIIVQDVMNKCMLAVQDRARTLMVSKKLPEKDVRGTLFSFSRGYMVARLNANWEIFSWIVCQSFVSNG